MGTSHRAISRIIYLSPTSHMQRQTSQPLIAVYFHFSSLATPRSHKRARHREYHGPLSSRMPATDLQQPLQSRPPLLPMSLLPQHMSDTSRPQNPKTRNPILMPNSSEQNFHQHNQSTPHI
ncbi:hypothetical protein AC578_2740 [Pseudocercospora eumusae]|uniref:Uncharacterized protein n=1 Tax=Pseudocercospora eumusae TaxID=321146 RepID=A0A139HGT4_9PEZI|nr:hypothetical protein AC578_2740 [Pseudocercospora eumusae]